MIELVKLAVEAVTCPRCSAQPGAPCSTVSGRRSTYTHSRRARPIYAAWRVGYGDGLRFAVNHPDTAARMIARQDAREVSA